MHRRPQVGGEPAGVVLSGRGPGNDDLGGTPSEARRKWHIPHSEDLRGCEKLSFTLCGGVFFWNRENCMPEISRFYGIIIAMFYSEHNPPHFHVRYGSAKGAIRIEDLAIIEGQLPPRVLGLVVEWAAGHREDLLADWERARQQKPLNAIDPLE